MLKDNILPAVWRRNLQLPAFGVSEPKLVETIY